MGDPAVHAPIDEKKERDVGVLVTQICHDRKERVEEGRRDALNCDEQPWIRHHQSPAFGYETFVRRGESPLWHRRHTFKTGGYEHLSLRGMRVMRLNDPQTLEARTQAIGRNLYDRACSNGESLFSVEGWTARLIRWSVRHEEVGSNSFVSSTSSRRSRR